MCEQLAQRRLVAWKVWITLPGNKGYNGSCGCIKCRRVRESFGKTWDQERIELVCIETVIANEIEQGLCQKQIAQSYALGLRSSWPTDWAKVNKMIISRWSIAGLTRIKNMAWSGSCFRHGKETS